MCFHCPPVHLKSAFALGFRCRSLLRQPFLSCVFLPSNTPAFLRRFSGRRWIACSRPCPSWSLPVWAVRISSAFPTPFHRLSTHVHRPFHSFSLPSLDLFHHPFTAIFTASPWPFWPPFHYLLLPFLDLFHRLFLGRRRPGVRTLGADFRRRVGPTATLRLLHRQPPP